MNFEHFHNLMNQGFDVCQDSWEWQLFLEFIEAYFKNRNIESPIIVEVGTGANHQRKHYEEFLGARYIGIDINADDVSVIKGNSHDEETLAKLRTRLDGKSINLLFIDACHLYGDVKQDYEMYAPLTKNIIAFHDIATRGEGAEVFTFWDELIKVNSGYAKLAITFNPVQFGIGLIVKE